MTTANHDATASVTFRKIHVLGGPGTGKTYSSSILSEATGIPLFHLDDLFWNPNSKKYVRTSAEIRDAQLAEILERDAWIVEGAYTSNWVSECLLRADMILFLSLPVWQRDWNILKRFAKFRLGFLKATHEETFANLVDLLIYNHKYDHEETTQIFETLSEHSAKLRVIKSQFEMLEAVKNV